MLEFENPTSLTPEKKASFLESLKKQEDEVKSKNIIDRMDRLRKVFMSEGDMYAYLAR